MPDQASLGLLGDDTSGIGYTLLDSETDTPRRGAREAIVLVLLFIIAIMSTVLAVVYSANSEALAAFISAAAVFALAFASVAIWYAVSLRANAAPDEKQQRGTSPERSHWPAQEVVQQPRSSTPDETLHRGEAALNAGVTPTPRSENTSQYTTTASSGIKTSPRVGATDSDRSSSTSQPAAPSPRANVTPAWPAQEVVQQPRSSTPDETLHRGEAALNAGVTPTPRSENTSQYTTTASSGIKTSPRVGATDSDRSSSTSQPAAPSPRANVTPAWPAQEVAQQLYGIPEAAPRRDDMYIQEEDVALAAGSSANADCVFIRLSQPIEWSLLRDNREVAHIRGRLDAEHAIEAPQLFYCDNKLHILARNGAIFRIDSASVVPAEYLGSTAMLEDAWMLLRPQLPEGQRIIGLARKVDTKSGEVHFPRGMHYAVAHCGALSDTIKKVMLDRDSAALPESPESRMRIFHQYVALHYDLARELTETGKIGVSLEAVRRFMSSPAGAGLARDLLDHQAEFQVSVEQDEHMLPEHSVFLSDALSALDSLDQEEVLRSYGVSQEVMCMLYSLSGATYLVKSDYDVMPAGMMNELTERLTAKFLADADFRGALIDLVVREVSNIIFKEQSPNQAAETDQTNVLGLDGVLARISSRRGMPWMCRAIPGLAQSVATAVLGLCGVRDINHRNVVSPGIVSQLHIIPGFDRVATGARLAEEGTKIAACYEQLCFDTVHNMALRPLIVTAAAAEAVQRSEIGRGSAATREKEDFFAVATEKYNNSSGVASAAERATTIRSLMSVLTRDDVEEIVAHTTAAWIEHEFGDLAWNYLSTMVRRDVGVSEYVARWLRNDTLYQEPLFSSAFSTEIRDCLFYTRRVDILAMSEGLRPAFGDLLTHQVPAEDLQTVAKRTSSDSTAETECSSPGRGEGAVDRTTLLSRASSAPTLNEGTSDFPAVCGIGDERIRENNAAANAQLRDESSTNGVSMTPEAMHEIAERESERVTRALQNASGVGARLKAGAKVRAHYMQNTYNAENFVAERGINIGSLSTGLPGCSLPNLSQAMPTGQDLRSASPVHTGDTSVARTGNDETGMFFSVNFEQPTVGPTVEPDNATPAQEDPARQDLRTMELGSSSHTDSLSIASGSLNSFLSGIATVRDHSRSASPMGSDKTSLPDIDNAEAELPQPNVGHAAEPASAVPVRESLTERGCGVSDAVSGPATELQQTAAVRVGGRSQRLSLSGESDVLSVGDNVAYVGEEALRRHDSVADPRVVLILEEFDVNTLQNTHPVKARMLAAMRQSASDAAITFYQQRIELPEDGCDARTFCVINGKSFKVAPDVRVAPPDRSIDSLLSEIPASPTSTKLVIKVPDVARGLSLSDGKLNFQRAEFDINGFAFPAVREVNCDGLMSLMLNNYIAHARDGSLLGYRTFDIYVNLQQQLFNDFVTRGEGRDYEMITPGQRWLQFVRSPVGSRFVGDIKRYMRSFRSVHDVMPDVDHKASLHGIMTAVSHNMVDAGNAGTSLEVLKALHALSSASYGVDCTNVQAEEQIRAITRKFLADEEFGIVLIMVAMESCLTALAVHFGRSSSSGNPTDIETIHATLNSTVPDICRRIPGLTTGIVGLLQRILGVNRSSTIGQSGQQSAIVTNIEKWVDGRQEAAEEIFSGFSLNQYLESADAPYMRNAIVACAQAKAAQRGDGSSRQHYYCEVAQEFLGDMNNIPNVVECEERIGTAIAGLNDNMLAELVADAVAYRVYRNLVNSHNPALGCEENLVNVFYGYFGNHRNPRDGAVQFARDLSTHSKQVISRFLAAERGVVREFLPSIMSSHSNVLFISAAAPCEVFICAPEQSARNVPPHTHNRELTEGEQGLGTTQHAR